MLCLQIQVLGHHVPHLLWLYPLLGDWTKGTGCLHPCWLFRGAGILVTLACQHDVKVVCQLNGVVPLKNVRALLYSTCGGDPSCARHLVGILGYFVLGLQDFSFDTAASSGCIPRLTFQQQTKPGFCGLSSLPAGFLSLSWREKRLVCSWLLAACSELVLQVTM